mgnify:FL=1
MVELMVVIFIILLMLEVATLATRRSQYRTELKNAAAEIKDAIDATRQYSLAPRVQAPTGTAGYCFSMDTANNNWVIREYVPDAVPPDKAALKGCSADFTSMRQGTISSRVIIQPSGIISDGFTTYGWSALVPAGNLISEQPVNITLRHDSISDTMQISIQPNGLAEVLWV